MSLGEMAETNMHEYTTIKGKSVRPFQLQVVQQQRFLLRIAAAPAIVAMMILLRHICPNSNASGKHLRRIHYLLHLWPQE
jgi:hypothetical protein